MNLYLLRFKNEPLFKLGLTERQDASRWSEMGSLERFDLERSFLVSALDPSTILFLERELKKRHSASRRTPQPPIKRAGNKEVFCLSAHPTMMWQIRRLRKDRPNLGIRIRRGLPSEMPITVTVCLSKERYNRLKVHGACHRQSNQQIMVQALDDYLKAVGA